MSPSDKPLRWLHGEIKSPPFSRAARTEVGSCLRALQRGYRLAMPQSRPMPILGPRCHELRVVDADLTWRVFYRIDSQAILIAAVFAKKTEATPVAIIEACKRRFREYDNA